MPKAPPATGLTTAAVRAIQALGAAPAGRADQIADRLAEAIRLGLIAPGERLPAEAALSEQFGVATLTLREALATLRERGLVVTRRGRAGGSFVAGSGGAAGAAGSKGVTAAAAGAEGAGVGGGAAGVGGAGGLTVRRLSELGDVRRAEYAVAAALAAKRATAPEIEALRRRVDRLAAARSAGERRRADGEFGIELAAAAQSPRLTQQEANLRAELGDLLWALMGDAEHAEAVLARGTLVDAVAGGDATLAVALAERQIAHETEALMRWRIKVYRAEAQDASAAEVERTWGELADQIEHIFRDLQATAEAFAASFAARHGRDRKRYTLGDLATLRPRIRATLDEFRGLAVGTGIVVAPGVLDDAAYWLEWWWRGPGEGAPESLRVNLDPQGPDFFDYVNNEWFDVPIKRGGRHVAGPYVDYACTNQYTFTLSVPAFHERRPLGVAAMDVPCDQLERKIMPALCADPAPRALLNAHGRVIAASAAGAVVPCAPGASAPASAALSRLCEVAGWTVVPLKPKPPAPPSPSASPSASSLLEDPHGQGEVVADADEY